MRLHASDVLDIFRYLGQNGFDVVDSTNYLVSFCYMQTKVNTHD